MKKKKEIDMLKLEYPSREESSVDLDCLGDTSWVEATLHVKGLAPGKLDITYGDKTGYAGLSMEVRPSYGYISLSLVDVRRLQRILALVEAELLQEDEV